MQVYSLSFLHANIFLLLLFLLLLSRLSVFFLLRAMERACLNREGSFWRGCFYMLYSLNRQLTNSRAKFVYLLAYLVFWCRARVGERRHLNCTKWNQSQTVSKQAPLMRSRERQTSVHWRRGGFSWSRHTGAASSTDRWMEDVGRGGTGTHLSIW